MNLRVDLTGSIFGKYHVLSFVEVGKSGKYIWFCECECGQKRNVPASNLIYGNSTNCGCWRITGGSYNFKHGHTNKSKEYVAWGNLKRRCYDPTCRGYKYYGGKGVKVCDRWLHSFVNFLGDMGLAPSKEHSIERLKTFVDYCPENCVWGTEEMQVRNKTNNRYFTLDGVSLILQDWARYFNVRQPTLHYWLRTKTIEEVRDYLDTTKDINRKPYKEKSKCIER